MIRRVLARFRGKPPEPDALLPIPRPLAPLAVLGDVHGRDDLLGQMLGQLAEAREASRMRVVLVGDMIDRGPGSAQVLARMAALARDPAPFAACLCLMGNHERMLLDALADPLGAAPRWLANGGDASLASFGLGLPHARGAEGAAPPLVAQMQALAARLGPLRSWLADLPLCWQEGAVFISHAGADAGRSLQAQHPDTLLWGRHSRPGPHPEAWVIHGHTILPEVEIGAGVIRVDTGAYRSGCLSAVLLGDADAPVVLQARAEC